MVVATVLLLMIQATETAAAADSLDRVCPISDQQLRLNDNMMTFIGYRRSGDEFVVVREPNDGPMTRLIFDYVRLTMKGVPYQKSKPLPLNKTAASRRVMVTLPAHPNGHWGHSFLQIDLNDIDESLRSSGDVVSGIASRPDKQTPEVVRKMLMATDDKGQPLSLHHSGAFYSRDGLIATLVGYYKQKGSKKTTVIAWDLDGEELARDQYHDNSDIISITGWPQGKDHEIVLSLHFDGFLCMSRRAYDGFHFIPSIHVRRFMPHCVQSRMLVGCPQSFCHSGQFDHLIRYTSDQRQCILLIRGQHAWTFGPSLKTGLDVSVMSLSSKEAERLSGDLMRAQSFASAAFVLQREGMVVFVNDTYANVFAALTAGSCKLTLALNGMLYDIFKGDLAAIPRPITAAVSKIDGEIAFYSGRKEVAFRVASDYRLSLGSARSLSHDADAAFLLTNSKGHSSVFFKSGQMIWSEGSSPAGQATPVLRHTQFNPGGIIELGNCWTGEENRQLIQAISDSHDQPLPDMLPLLQLSARRRQISVRNVVRMQATWWLIFAPVTVLLFAQAKHQETVMKSGLNKSSSTASTLGLSSGSTTFVSERTTTAPVADADA